MGASRFSLWSRHWLQLKLLDSNAIVGCMLESKLGIAATLAVANAVNNVKYTDLDGFTYLTEQPFNGGVELKSGTDYPVDGAGLAAKRNKDIGQLNF